MLDSFVIVYTVKSCLMQSNFWWKIKEEGELITRFETDGFITLTAYC